MNLFTAEVILLCVSAGLLVVFAVVLRKRLQVGDDFALGRRRLGPRLGGIAITMNGIPTWWLLLLAALAYADGGSAIWPGIALIGGVVIGGWSLAPRLRARAQMQQLTTVSQLFAGDAGEKMHRMLMRSAALIVIATAGLTLVAQLQIASGFLADALATSRDVTIVAIVLVLVTALLFSGFWTTVIADLAQIAVLLAVGAMCILALFVMNLHTSSAKFLWSQDEWFGGQQGLLTVSFLVGIAFLIGDAAGQSSLLMRFMACKDDVDLIVARKRAVFFAAIAVLVAIFAGWSVRSLSPSDPPSIDALGDVLLRALPPNVASILMLLLLVAMIASMSNAFLTAASHMANDFRRPGRSLSLARCRFALTIAALFAGAFAIYLPQSTLQGNFDRMLFGWHAMGAAFGPLIIVRLSGKRIRPGSTLGAMWAGFLLTIVFHLMPTTPGDLLERSLPFTASLGIALSGGERRRNPDRADRGERTIHDRLPI